MTVTVIDTCTARSARPGTSLTVATRLITPVLSAPGVTVTVAPLCVTVAPDAGETLSTWMSGCASGLVTYWLRSIVTLWPASALAVTAVADGGGAAMTSTVSVPDTVPPAGVI